MTDPDVFEERWTEHINELSRLKLALDGDGIDRINDIQRELKDLVGEVADERRE